VRWGYWEALDWILQTRRFQRDKVVGNNIAIVADVLTATRQIGWIADLHDLLWRKTRMFFVNPTFNPAVARAIPHLQKLRLTNGALPKARSKINENLITNTVCPSPKADTLKTLLKPEKTGITIFPAG
jgi:hypothetical protein